MAQDHRYRNIGNHRLSKVTRPSLAPVQTVQRGVGFASPDSGGQAAVRPRPQLETLIADLAASFVSLPAKQIDPAIGEGLHHLVEALGVDHAAFYQITGDGLAIVHAWPLERLEASSDSLKADDLAWLAGGLCRRSVLVISQPEALSGQTLEERFLSRLGLRSAVLVGVKTGGSLLGILMLGSSTEEIAWSGELEQLLDILGAVFAEALARKTTEESFLKSDNLNHAMLDSLESHIVVVDNGGKVIAVSAGRHFAPESGLALLTSVKVGDCYLDTCRLARESGFESAGTVLEGIESVVDGTRGMFEMEYESLSPSGQRFFQISVTPLGESGSGAVISHSETTERRMAQARLRELSGKMIRSLEEERTRIARELHDDVSQRLALMGIEMEQIIQSLTGKQTDVGRRLKDLWRRNQETSLEVRRLSHHLHSSKLEYLGLVAALKSLCAELSKNQTLRIGFKHFDVPSSIPRDVALCIYRVVQESLRNAAKHSGARDAQVTLYGTSGEINLSISDEGSGFDPDSVKAQGGIGLIGMRERLHLIGGEISIDSRPSQGTRIAARVPLEEHDQGADVLKRS